MTTNDKSAFNYKLNNIIIEPFRPIPTEPEENGYETPLPFAQEIISSSPSHPTPSPYDYAAALSSDFSTAAPTPGPEENHLISPTPTITVETSEDISAEMTSIVLEAEDEAPDLSNSLSSPQPSFLASPPTVQKRSGFRLSPLTVSPFGANKPRTATPQLEELYHPIVVGHSPSSEELQLLEQVRACIDEADRLGIAGDEREIVGMKKLVRGTYVVSQTNISESGRNKIQDVFTGTAKKIEIIIYEYLGSGNPIAIVKPRDEVRGGENYKGTCTSGKDGIDPAWEIPHEVIAAGLTRGSVPSMEVSLVDNCFVNKHANFKEDANLQDANLELLRKGGNLKVSKRVFLQKFIPDLVNIDNSNIQKINIEDIQKIAIMDISLCNTDRNGSNLLVSSSTNKLYPIDHANILPKKFGSNAVFIWMHWPQAHAPYSAKSLEEIAGMDFAADRAKILATYPNYPTESLDTMKVCYHLLKQGSAKGLSPFDIGVFIVGPFANYIDMPSPMRKWYNAAAKINNDPEAICNALVECIDQGVQYIADNAQQIKEKALENHEADSIGYRTAVQDAYAAGLAEIGNRRFVTPEIAIAESDELITILEEVE